MAYTCLRLRRAAYAVFMALVIGLAAAPADSATHTESKASTAGAPVFVLRGMWGIFSSGMDSLADELNADGVNAVSVAFDPWREYTASIIKAYRAHPYPIALVGHSWGANTILLIAYELNKHHIPVALLVFYDITESARIPPNVQWVIDYRSDTFLGGHLTVVGGNGFTGKIDKIVRTDLDHVQIDKAEDLHAQTIAAIEKVLGEKTASQGQSPR